MFKPFTTLSALFVSALVLVNSAWADAERDFQQPITVDADHEELDLRAGRLTFRDNVLVQQGSLRIGADELNVINEDGDEIGEGEIFIATGNPSTYQQELEPDVLVEASADEIRYDSRIRVLTLSGNAQMRQSGNQVSASRITYYVDEQRITAERDDESEERVRTIFQPRQNETN